MSDPHRGNPITELTNGTEAPGQAVAMAATMSETIAESITPSTFGNRNYFALEGGGVFVPLLGHNRSTCQIRGCLRLAKTLHLLCGSFWGFRVKPSVVACNSFRVRVFSQPSYNELRTRLHFASDFLHSSGPLGRPPTCTSVSISSRYPHSSQRRNQVHAGAQRKELQQPAFDTSFKKYSSFMSRYSSGFVEFVLWQASIQAELF
jgi:hypothetical protein